MPAALSTAILSSYVTSQAPRITQGMLIRVSLEHYPSLNGFFFLNSERAAFSALGRERAAFSAQL
jgi:hypothetical protein